MRIGLSGGGNTVERIIEQAVGAERDGFTSLWYAGAVSGDPLVAMALAGRATATLELGTSILPTYPCHPLLMANRAAALVAAMGRSFTLGVGPSHAPVIEGVYGQSFAHPGRHTEEYLTILMPVLRGEAVDFVGEDLTAHSGGRGVRPDAPVPVLVAALGPRLLRVAGETTDGTILWMATARAVADHVAPRIRAASAGRAEPRIVAGLPLAVHDDVDEARNEAASQFGFYGDLPNYRRILDIGGVAGPADAAIVGDEAAVTAQIEALFDAGATDVWAAPFPVGADRSGSAPGRVHCWRRSPSPDARLPWTPEEGGRMHVHVDPDRCQGHNRCYALAPSLFEVDDLGYATEVNGGLVPPDQEEAARRAAANCPEYAISIIESDEGGRR